jgi:cytochrome c553
MRFPSRWSSSEGLTLSSSTVETVKLVHGGDAAKGQKLHKDCADCHGVAGNVETPDVPDLGGQDPLYIYKQLSDYKTNSRASSIMNEAAKDLSDRDMADLAAFYAAQRPARSSGPALVSNGAAVKLATVGDGVRLIPACGACHGDHGAGNPSFYGMPALKDQKSQDLTVQLMAFRSGERANDVYRVMRDLCKHLTDSEIGRPRLLLLRSPAGTAAHDLRDQAAGKEIGGCESDPPGSLLGGDVVHHPLVARLQGLELHFREVLDADEPLARSFQGRDDLVQLHVDRESVLVLRALDQEHHEERHDGGGRVHDELPGVRPVKERTGGGPDHHQDRRDREGRGAPRPAGDSLGEAFAQASRSDAPAIRGEDSGAAGWSRGTAHLLGDLIPRF